MEELLIYLRGLLDDTKLSLYEDFHRISKLFGYVEHEHEITELLNSSEEGEMVKIFDAMNDILHSASNNILLQHDLVVSGTLDEKVKVTEALYNLTNWGERELLFDMSNSPDTPSFILSEMLEHVSPHDKFFFLEKIESVSNSLINRIRELYQPLDGEVVEINLNRLSVVKKYIEKHRSTWIEDLLTVHMVPLELDIDTLFKIVDERLQTINKLDDKDAAIQIVGIYLISDNPIGNLSMIIKEHMDNIYPSNEDLATMTRVYSCVQELIMSEGLNG